MMKKIFFTFVLFSNVAWAQSPLTEQRRNITLNVKPGPDMSLGDYQVRARAILNFIENKIYPKVPASHLTEVNKKTLVIDVTPTIKKGGIFDPSLGEKNELVIQIRDNLFADDSVFRILAHEWFHALHYVIHKDEPAWVREGLAQVFESIVLGGYNGPNLLAALDGSTTSLEFVFDENTVNREAYGHTFIYFYFLYKRCGGDSTFWKIAESATGQFGPDSIQAALKDQSAKECSDYETSVLNAEIARFHNRKIQGKLPSDRYWLIPEFERTPQTVNEGLLDQSVIDALPIHRPLLLSSKYKTSLKRFEKNPKLSIYTLSKRYPYTVEAGINSSPESSDEVLFVLKRK